MWEKFEYGIPHSVFEVTRSELLDGNTKSSSLYPSNHTMEIGNEISIKYQ